MMPALLRAALLATAGLAALSLSSCQKSLRLYPVRGQVFVDGQPAEGARVMFHPANDSNPLAPAPAGFVKADGSFEMATYIDAEHSARPGALAGEYLVSVRWFPLDTGKYKSEIPDKLGGKYADPNTTGLRIQVREQENMLEPFQLTKKP